MESIKVGMIGYKFMGKAHSHAYRDLPMFFPDHLRPEMKVICGRNPEGVAQAASQYGWEEYTTNWKDLIRRDDIDLIDINAPSDVHKEITLAAAQAGKHIFCEKPLALTLQDSRHMLEAVEAAGVKHMVGFNYRFTPAVLLAKKLIAEGRLGDIYHFRAWFLQDWIVAPDFPLVWRLQKDIAGSGAHGDLGAHLIDMAHFLIGDITEVIGMNETFIKERPLPTEMTGLSGRGSNDHTVPKGPVTVDDATLFMARFANGALGSFEATRFATGHRSTNSFEINGSKGSVIFDFERLNELQVYFTDDQDDVQGFRRVLATDGAHAYSDRWWPAGHTIGYEHTFIHEIAELMESLQEGRQPVPNFKDGVKCQQVLEAVDLSIAKREWIQVSDL
ncbi:Gfo/Idh/MocA family oxidoreductase [Halalkalibacterium halodurans]|uniref:BH0710 protein n=1 Tax=Halalkalibacterium halodurans (strain ATCC BAA-125 / DSM 18197 / FERM 7344 / JCM 9153 / C-125) TaxID=272558 RepID=Q9KEY9_HALH5|nr:Gfo/Idh/MocA family oxidoreductase [Halalkalibacterium halodurans]MED4080336.1 Gfo/Idh/MocA family oxidoreductase [Halalkalibacterium halodurans]MED4084600.1 Gfo/Idh/MocA family oxidoreductase [Halalkalibacterium halodurans]MED4104836.1 Gfo/Idh/MocA family oxidoreductase [Halalkalibacterium halodurans]MED4109723.1 Gfo/Idh/MocA family oxidoreductase [Halalkalibacterium halodurans]MED4122959.1 Gfo/Idh/MocA family oxidoreductase [Halalkalibacterium halodurans]